MAADALASNIPVAGTEHDEKVRKRPVPPAAQTIDPPGGGRARPVCLPWLRQSAGLSRLDGLYPSAEDFIARRARYLYGRRGSPTSEALADALREIEGPDCVGVALLPSGLATISTALGAQRRRSRAGGRHRLSATRRFLRRGAHALRHHHHLLRPVDRCRHCRADAAAHARGLRGDAGLAVVRDPGRAGDRGRRPRQGRARAHGQYLCDAPLFPRLREGRRPVDPGRHQIYRRPLGCDAGHGIGQQGDLGARLTSISVIAGCAPWGCGSPITTRPA